MLATVMATQPGQAAFSGERLTLRGVTCACCCESVTSKVRELDGVKNAEIDMVRMELVISRDRDKIDLGKILEAIRHAGFEATPK